jgi:hypothetical protein
MMASAATVTASTVTAATATFNTNLIVHCVTGG